jgi:hypothetical protein
MEKQLTTPEHQARSKRVWSLRQITGLSRREFAKRYGVAAGTLQNWEDPGGNGLSEKGAYRLTITLKSAGIYCNVEWLMHGVGDPPHVNETTAPPAILALKKDISIGEYEQAALKAELQVFCSHYPESIYFQIPDDSMLPFYHQGDFVAGSRVYQNDIAQLIGEDCIVLLSNGEQAVRRLRASAIPGLYDLMSVNPQTHALKPYYYDANLVYAARIIWSRRISKNNRR